MKKYDIIVIGSGCGLLIVEAAAAKGWKTAIIEKGKLVHSIKNADTSS